MQSHTEAHRGIQRHTETYRSILRHTKAYRCTQRHTEAYSASIPGITIRAFADDAAVVLPSWSTQSKKLNTIMATYSNITTMQINPKKTIVIHLGDAAKHPDPEAQSPRYTWDTKGKYLGYMIGPGAGDTSWRAPTDKYTGRLSEWPWSKMGTYLSIRVYNTFILPTLLLIVQLEHPPQNTIQAEDRLTGRIAPGRGKWCPTITLSHLRDIGAPAEIRDLRRTASSAMARVAQWEGSQEGGIRWSHLTHELYQAGKNAANDNRIFNHRYWHEKHFATTLHAHRQQLRTKYDITAKTVRQAVTHHSLLPLTHKDHRKWKKTTQKYIHQVLRSQSTHNIEEQIRKRLLLWKIPNFH